MNRAASRPRPGRGTALIAAAAAATAAVLASSCAASGAASQPRSGGAAGTAGAPASVGGGGSGGSAGGGNGNACAGALLCDDFEAYTLGNAPAGAWKVSTNQGVVRIDGAHAASGTKAVRVTTNPGTGTYRRAFFSIEGAPVFPVPGNVLYGRMLVWLTAAPEGSVHWTNIQGEGPVPNMSFRALVRYGGQQQKHFMANYETQGVASDCYQHSATTIPEGRWTCMEWRLNGPNNEMNFWLDGVALDDITVVNRGSGCISQGTAGNWYAPAYDTIRLGWEHYQQSVSHDMWIDDVVLDVKRIGCPPCRTDRAPPPCLETAAHLKQSRRGRQRRPPTTNDAVSERSRSGGNLKRK